MSKPLTNAKQFAAYPPDGGEPIFSRGLKPFCEARGIKYQSARNAATGKQRLAGGWAFRWLDENGEPIEPGKAAQDERDRAIARKAAKANTETPEAKGEAPNGYGSHDRDDDAKARIRKAFKVLSEKEVEYLNAPNLKPAGWRPDITIKVLQAEADANNIKWEDIADDRDPLDKATEAFTRMRLDGSAIFEQQDETIEAMILGVERTLELGYQQFDDYDRMRARDLVREGTVPEGEDPEEPPGPKTLAESAKQWVDRLRKVLEIRRQVRTPHDHGVDRRTRIVQESTQTLRFMLYVTRSGVKQNTLAAPVFSIGKPHVKMSMSLWLSRRGFTTSEYGLIGPGDLVGIPGSKFEFKGIHYGGTISLAPPRHGKTNLLASDAALSINIDHRIQMAYVHRREKEAMQFVGFVSSMFNMDTGAGRRNHSLYPYKLDKSDNNSSTLRLHNAERPKNPNLIAAPVSAAGQGNDLDRLYVDDVTHRDDQTQPATREAIKQRLSSTWVSRLQGEKGEMVLSGYPWHHEDALWTYLQKARRAADTAGREGITLWVCMQPVGDPKTNPKFFSIWPEMYPPNKLRQRYLMENDAAAWAANYTLNPVTSDTQIVRQVALYDPKSEEHRQFIENGAESMVSVDPTAKGDGTGDSAGWVEALLGQSKTLYKGDDGVERRRYIDLIRITTQDEIQATQYELSRKISERAQAGPVDEVFIEVVTGLGTAMIEVLEENFGITSITECGTGGKSKEQRLRAVAPMLEDSSDGLSAVVQFPGKPILDENGEPTGRLEPIDQIKPLINYIVNFKVASGFHSLDACTQMLQKLKARVNFQGQVSIEAAAKEPTQNRVAKSIAGIVRRHKHEQSSRRGQHQFYSTHQT